MKVVPLLLKSVSPVLKWSKEMPQASSWEQAPQHTAKKGQLKPFSPILKWSKRASGINHPVWNMYPPKHHTHTHTHTHTHNHARTHTHMHTHTNTHMHTHTHTHTHICTHTHTHTQRVYMPEGPPLRHVCQTSRGEEGQGEKASKQSLMSEWDGASNLLIPQAKHG